MQKTDGKAIVILMMEPYSAVRDVGWEVAEI